MKSDIQTMYDIDVSVWMEHAPNALDAKVTKLPYNVGKACAKIIKITKTKNKLNVILSSALPLYTKMSFI